MPLDVLGRTRATLTHTASTILSPRRQRGNLAICVVMGIDLWNYRS